MENPFQDKFCNVSDKVLLLVHLLGSCFIKFHMNGLNIHIMHQRITIFD